MADRTLAPTTAATPQPPVDGTAPTSWVGSASKWLGGVAGEVIGSFGQGVSEQVTVRGLPATIRGTVKTLTTAAGEGAAEGALHTAQAKVSGTVSSLIFRPDDKKAAKVSGGPEAASIDDDSDIDEEDLDDEDASLPPVSLPSIFASIASGNIDASIGINILGQFFGWAKENIGNDKVFRSMDSGTLDRLAKALDSCISLLNKYSKKKISLQDCMTEVRNKIGDFHPLLLGILEIPFIGKSDEATDPLSLEQSKDIDVLDRHAGLEGKKTFNDLRVKAKAEQKRFAENIALFSAYQFVHYMVGTQKTDAEIDMEVRLQLDTEDIDQSSDEWQERYDELKKEYQDGLGGKDSTFSAFMQRLEKSDVSDEDRKAQFNKYLSDYITNCSTINVFKRITVRFSLSIIVWAFDFFSEKMTAGLINWIKKNIITGQAHPDQVLNPAPFESGVNATDEMIRAYTGFKDEKPLASGENPGAPKQYLKGKLDEKKFDYNRLTAKIIAQSLPGLELTAPINRAIKTINDWASRDKGILATIFCYSLAVIPMSFLWLINGIFVYPFDALTNYILREITSSVLNSNHVIESIIKHDTTALEASEFACSIEEVVALLVEQVYETLRSQKTEATDGLEGLDPNQKDEITKAINGFLLNLFKVADLSALPNRDEVKAMLESDDHVMQALKKLPQKELDKLRVPRIIDSLVNVLIVLMKEAYTQKSSELYLGKILEAANRSIINHDKLDTEDSIKERQDDVRRTRMHYQDMIVRLSVESSVNKTIRDLGLVHQEASQNYIDWLQDTLLGSLDVDGETRNDGKIDEWEGLLSGLLDQDESTHLDSIIGICEDVTHIYKTWRKHQERMEMDSQMATSAKSPAILAMRKRFRDFIDQLVLLQNTIMYKQLDDKVIPCLDEIKANIHLIKLPLQPTSPAADSDEEDETFSIDDLKKAVRDTRKAYETLTELSSHLPKQLNQFIVELNDIYIPKMGQAVDKFKVIDAYETVLTEIKDATSYGQIKDILTAHQLDRLIPIIDIKVQKASTYADATDPLASRAKDVFKELLAEEKKAAAKIVRSLDMPKLDAFIDQIKQLHDDAVAMDDDAMQELTNACILTLDAEDDAETVASVEHSLLEEIRSLDISHYPGSTVKDKASIKHHIQWMKEALLGIDSIDDSALEQGKISAWATKLEEAASDDTDYPEDLISSVIQEANATYKQFSKYERQIAKDPSIDEKDKQAVLSMKTQFKVFIERLTAFYDMTLRQEFREEIMEQGIICEQSLRIITSFLTDTEPSDDDMPLLGEATLAGAKTALTHITNAIATLKDADYPVPTDVQKLIEEAEKTYIPAIEKTLSDLKRIEKVELVLRDLQGVSTYAAVSSILETHGLKDLQASLDVFVRSNKDHRDAGNPLLERAKDALRMLVQDEKLRVHQSIELLNLDTFASAINGVNEAIINATDTSTLKDACLEALNVEHDDASTHVTSEPSLSSHIKSLRPVDYVDVHLMDTTGFIRFINGFFYTATKDKINSIISALQQPVIVGKLAEEMILRPILES